jgi:hypothetical protein
MPTTWRSNPRLSEVVRRITQGRYRWGRVSLDPSPFSVTRYVLTLYPPGLDRAGRIRLQAAESWRTIVAPLWLVLFSVVAANCSATLAALAASAACLTGWLVVRRLTRRLRGDVVQLWGASDSGASTGFPMHELWLMVDGLTAADDALARGELSPVGHEMAWASTYEQAASYRRAQRSAAACQP